MDKVAAIRHAIVVEKRSRRSVAKAFKVGRKTIIRRSAAAPVHVLVVPKKHITGLSATHGPDGALLGQLLVVANHVARELKLHNSGYRVVINDGVDAGQTVPHLHVHLLGGRALAWPPG